MSPRLRLILGFVGAPLVPQLCLLKTIDRFPGGEFPQVIVVGVLLVAYVLMLASGTTTHLILRRQGRDGWFDYAFTGAMTGAALGVAIVVLVRVFEFFVAEFYGTTANFVTVDTVIAFGLLGAILMVWIASCFWLIARPDRP